MREGVVFEAGGCGQVYLLCLQDSVQEEDHRPQGACPVRGYLIVCSLCLFLFFWAGREGGGIWGDSGMGWIKREWMECGGRLKKGFATERRI